MAAVVQRTSTRDCDSRNTGSNPVGRLRPIEFAAHGPGEGHRVRRVSRPVREQPELANGARRARRLRAAARDLSPPARRARRAARGRRAESARWRRRRSATSSGCRTPTCPCAAATASRRCTWRRSSAARRRCGRSSPAARCRRRRRQHLRRAPDPLRRGGRRPRVRARAAGGRGEPERHPAGRLHAAGRGARTTSDDAQLERSCLASTHGARQTSAREVDLAVRARAGLRAVDEVQPLDRRPAQARDELHPRASPSAGRAGPAWRRARTRPSPPSRRRSSPRSRPAPASGPSPARRGRRTRCARPRRPRVDLLLAIVEELHRRRPGYGSSSWRASIRNGRVPRATRLSRPSGIRSSTSAISHAQPIGRSPSSASQTIPNSDSSSRQRADHRLVALLEDVQRHQFARQGDEPEREQREVPDQSTRGSSAEADRAAPYPTRWLRPRSSGSGATCACTTTRRCGRRSDAHERDRAGVRARRPLLHGRHASGSRTRSCSTACSDLRGALQQRGGNLVVVRGKPERELLEAGPRARRRRRPTSPPTSSPFAHGSRPSGSRARSETPGVEPRRTPGNFVADIGKPKPYAVFTPFWRAWKRAPAARRPSARRARSPSRADLAVGDDPEPRRAQAAQRRPDPMQGGETAGRKRMLAWLERHRDLRTSTTAWTATPRCCRPYLHFGCRLARASSRRRTGGATRRSRASSRGATSTPTCCCTTRATRARLPARAGRDRVGRRPTSTSTPGARAAPAIRSSTPACASWRTTGWMHNRARLITACFLVKDLHIDWRRGERHFMRLPARRRRGQQQRQLAVDLLGRRRPRAAAPAPLQPGAAAAAPRSRRRVRAPLGPGAA